MRFILCSFLFLAASLPAPAQTENREPPQLIDFGASLRSGYVKPQTPPRDSNANPDNEVIRIDTNLVMSDVLILNEKGFAVDGLTKNDFIVSEDDAAQQIDTFSQGDNGTVPRSIVLIMDYSTSLRPYVQASIAAAKVLIDKLGPKDKMAIVTDNVELLTPFTHDKQLLKQKLDLLADKSVTGKPSRSDQYSALIASLNELFDAEDVRPIVIFQTDGDEYVFLKNNFRQLPAALTSFYYYMNISERNFSYQDVVTAMEKARVTVYGIIPGLRFLGLTPEQQLEQGRFHYRNQKAAASASARKIDDSISKDQMERGARFYSMLFPLVHKSVVSVALTSGGWAEYLETPEKAADIYSKVLADINNRYLLGYYPTNQLRDGTRRTIKIEVKDHPEYQILTRKSYYALPAQQ